MNKLSEQSISVIRKVIEEHQNRMGPVKLMLHDIQHELGYIPLEAMEMISEATGTPVAEVYGVVTFYTQFTTAPKGKYVVGVCMGTACYVKGSQKVMDKVIECTKAPLNGTSPDGMFSVDATRCIGACGLAPALMINGKVYGNLKPDMIPNIIKSYHE